MSFLRRFIRFVLRSAALRARAFFALKMFLLFFAMLLLRHFSCCHMPFRCCHFRRLPRAFAIRITLLMFSAARRRFLPLMFDFRSFRFSLLISICLYAAPPFAYAIRCCRRR